MVAIIASVWCAARAAELDGVRLPDTLQADGKTLHLNGFGVRTDPILGIHIYVAGLYLEHLSTDADAILESPETKLLLTRFEHGVSADAARDAWRKGLENNCQPPCRLEPEALAQFVAQIPAMHAGESYSILFTGQGATVTANGIEFGVIANPRFARAMLATFLGDLPASPRLKAALLQGHQ